MFNWIKRKNKRMYLNYLDIIVRHEDTSFKTEFNYLTDNEVEYTIKYAMCLYGTRLIKVSITRL